MSINNILHSALSNTRCEKYQPLIEDVRENNERPTFFSRLSHKMSSYYNKYKKWLFGGTIATGMGIAAYYWWQKTNRILPKFSNKSD